MGFKLMVASSTGVVKEAYQVRGRRGAGGGTAEVMGFVPTCQQWLTGTPGCINNPQHLSKHL